MQPWNHKRLVDEELEKEFRALILEDEEMYIRILRYEVRQSRLGLTWRVLFELSPTSSHTRADALLAHPVG